MITIAQIAKHVSVSTCGKYVYPIDSIAGTKCFAPIEYFLKSLESNFGNDLKRYVKEYTSRETKKYLKEGYTTEQIKEIAGKYKNNKLPKINVKLKKDPRIPKKERKKRLQSQAAEEIVKNEDGTEQVIKIYAWSHDPTHYFKSPVAALSIGELTKEACMRPDIYLDSECHGCLLYKECLCELKIVPKNK